MVVPSPPAAQQARTLKMGRAKNESSRALARGGEVQQHQYAASVGMDFENTV